jgi:hypothetical protein
LDIEELETAVSPEFPNFLAGKSIRGCEIIGFVKFYIVCIKRWGKSIKEINSDVIHYRQNPKKSSRIIFAPSLSNLLQI